MVNFKYKLQSRALIKVSGQDIDEYFQGLITNDITKINGGNLLYSLILSPQGRFAFDIFLFKINENYIIDCFELVKDELIKKLKFYKLRKKIIFEEITQPFSVIQTSKSNIREYSFKDPRSNHLGFREYYFQEIKAECEDGYQLLRIDNLIPEGSYDLISEKSIPLEFEFDKFNAIDFEKGCYIGQELTARTHYRGKVRKEIRKIESLKNEILPERGSEIFAENSKIGVMCGSVRNKGLALFRIENIKKALDENHKIFVDDIEVKL